MAVALLTAITGCGDSSQPSIKLQPVKGNVRLKGQPTPGAIVTFHPVNAPTAAKTPFGVVGLDGTFQLATERPNDGAEPGEYVVTVSWPKSSGGDNNDGPERIPARYLATTSTPLKVTVQSSADELPVFELQ